ncbi:1-aminocyclopropane-1-carboxylate deaminase [Colletotrichum orchidophilum]|uniref:1-aminocyclopropane-1-carboxylate deaminase n=1 Tax=Colletotrichum orchidophilum TaxID=1209926 RepID=A0A1G4B4B5_9PEZI|nr:1-aminocyclopropane-1-carboxylate deaminase [Colletotrichum orchidophilum]OHE96270.1 1-aminocyclopropane-1-carboxylate deaminase [Colletotrichum orchidophilum]
MVNLPFPFSEIPRVRLLYDRPIDIERLDRLAKLEGISTTSLWIARDDCNSGLAFGGNKVRKLEYVLADAINQGADTLVTTGGTQSNHMRQTAAAAAKLGLKVALFPVDVVPSGDPEYKYAGNIQLNEILGAETFPANTSQDDVISALTTRGRKPYVIPAGASTHPLGGLGYARWAFELLDQEDRLGEPLGHIIVVAVGSGSTLGGMVAGFKLAQQLGRNGARKRLVGYSILRKPEQDVAGLVLDIARTTAEKIGLDPASITKDDFEIDYDYLGGSYGHLDERTADGIKTLARAEGILTDPVYTGKAFTGLLHTAKQGGFDGNATLFLHTGGQAALSAYPKLKQ